MGTLGHAGRWLTDAAGRVVILHGVNLVHKLPPYHPAGARIVSPPGDRLLRLVNLAQADRVMARVFPD